MTTISTSKRVSDTLADLRILFKRYGIEDYEPIPEDNSQAYSIRYYYGGEWQLISSRSQPTRAQNLRQCFQVIQYLLIWASRGVSGVTRGVTFIHGSLATTGATGAEETLAEAYTTIGVEPTATWEEVEAVYRAKVRHNHPDLVQDQEEKQIREDRLTRLNAAYEKLEKARRPG